MLVIKSKELKFLIYSTKTAESSFTFISSNDASIVLAEYVAGSEENFAKLMNEKAKEIGCLNSNFTPK